ncbi:MAG: hypothetical protein HC923_10835, partial [Myxococcales bacterium]|nr:hypothetical protein [Myxococcales bacterium]
MDGSRDWLATIGRAIFEEIEPETVEDSMVIGRDPRSGRRVILLRHHGGEEEGLGRWLEDLARRNPGAELEVLVVGEGPALEDTLRR